MNNNELDVATDIYRSTQYLEDNINVGGSTVHARRMPGRYRVRQWLTTVLIYGAYYLLPYLSWDSRQALLLDIPERKFYFFNSVVWPQDLWMLALLLLFCFVLLFAMTALAGRVFCGFICPQTTGINIFSAIESWIEGSPRKRMQLQTAPLSAEKIAKRISKHAIWLLISALTAITFVGYFSGIQDAWSGFFSITYNNYEWITFVTIGTLFYLNAGFIREQFCMWVCPYARIQGVLTDGKTQVVSFDFNRGEPRGKIQKNASTTDNGDCVDCNLCVAVCPTGVDIRKGYQLGCINCGICIDACDMVMDKLNRSLGLIRFASHQEIETGSKDKHPYLRTRPIMYSLATLLSLLGIFAGMMAKSDIDMNIHHERSPVFTLMSDGSIQNIYHINLLNKTEHAEQFMLSVSGIDDLQSNIKKEGFRLKSGQVKKLSLRIRVPLAKLTTERQALTFELHAQSSPDRPKLFRSMFIGPRDR